MHTMLPTINKAVRIHGKGDLRIEEVPIPEPKENHVLLRMSTVGLCRTDVHLFDEGRVDDIIISNPITIGHEISGTISRLGTGVTSLAVGDRVAIDPCRPCGYCRYCLKGRTNICENMILSGVIKIDGGFAYYMSTPVSTCHKLPNHVSLEEGAMMEPMSVVVFAIKRAQMSPGDSVIVIGAGPIGLFGMQCAKAMGAGRVMIVDINESRLSLAKQLGVDVTLNPTKTSDPQQAGEKMKAALGDAADLVLECSGGHGTVDAAIHACRKGAKVVMIGFGEMAMHVHIGMAAVREIDVIGAFANANTFPECVELVASGKVNVKSVISHRLPLAKVREGMELIRKGESVKVVIDCME